MEWTDDDLEIFAQRGAAPLPPADSEAYVLHDGARLWYRILGAGTPVILLHGGLGHAGNWGYQLSALLNSGYRVLLIDSRGHGRSTRDARPFTYERMAADLLAIMDAVQWPKSALVGWSDGACTAMVFARHHPERVLGVFFFACNMDPSGTLPFTENARVERCFSRHARDYAELSATPDQFESFVSSISTMMKTEPNYSAEDLAQISVPVAIVHSEYDEFIKLEHAAYLAQTIPAAEFILLRGVSHFAPLQRPQVFNKALLNFLKRFP